MRDGYGVGQEAGHRATDCDGPLGPKQEAKVSEPPPIDADGKRPQNVAMSDLTREELKASTAASEAKVAATLEIMRREGSEARAELKVALSGIQAENAEFRGQMKEALAQMNATFATQSRDVESKISGLKIWVLAGALSGALAVLLMLGGVFARGYFSSSTGDPPAANAAHPSPPPAPASAKQP